MLAGGAKGYAVEEVVERMKDINSEAYLAIGTNYIFGTLHYSKEHQDETLGIANAHLVSPAVDESWLVRIRDSFSEGIKASRSSGEVQAFNAMRWSLLGDQPLREFLSLDNDDNINRVSVSDVKDWVSSTLVRRGVHVVVAGDMDTDAAGRVVDTLFTGLKDASVEEVDKNTMNFSASRILMHTPNSETTTLSLISQLPSPTLEHEWADLLINDELGGGADSLLFDVVRSKLRSTYSFNSLMIRVSKTNRILVLTGQVEESKVDEAELAIKEAYTTFLNTGITRDIQKIKSPYEQNMKENLKDTGTMGTVALELLMDGNTDVSPLEINSFLSSVSAQSVQLRLQTGFPKAEEFMVIVNSPNAAALKNACVIETPREAVDC